MTRSRSIALAALGMTWVTGCTTSGPVPAGRDTYLLSNTGAWSWSSGAALKGDLYRRADGFCRSLGKELMPSRSVSNNGSFSDFAHAEFEFRCLGSDDPELGRPRMRSQPNVIIENRILSD
jgi:hypothetical protein